LFRVIVIVVVVVVDMIGGHLGSFKIRFRFAITVKLCPGHHQP